MAKKQITTTQTAPDYRELLNNSLPASCFGPGFGPANEFGNRFRAAVQALAAHTQKELAAIPGLKPKAKCEAIEQLNDFLNACTLAQAVYETFGREAARYAYKDLLKQFHHHHTDSWVADALAGDPDGCGDNTEAYAAKFEEVWDHWESNFLLDGQMEPWIDRDLQKLVELRSGR
jgi:hypothetical protein